jgi:hypothetical protein
MPSPPSAAALALCRRLVAASTATPLRGEREELAPLLALASRSILAADGAAAAEGGAALGCQWLAPRQVAASAGALDGLGVARTFAGAPAHSA